MRQPDALVGVLADAMRKLSQGPTAEERAELASHGREAELRQLAQRRADERKARAACVEHLPITDADREAIADGTLEPTLALRAVQRWLEVKPSPWLVLIGGTGTGKTVAAAYAMAAAASRFQSSAYISATRLRPMLTRAVWDGDEMPREATAGLVVLDDLGAEKETDPEKFRAALCELLNTRQSMRTRTIITSNLTRQRLGDPSVYGARVVDRLNHLAQVVELRGDTMRRKVGGL